MTMDMILFGAGASAFSGDVRPASPPLGADLFAALSLRFRSWRSLPLHAKEEFQRNGLFEPGFDYIRQHHDELTPQLLVDMAIFFLQFYPGPQNAYLKFAKQITDRQAHAHVTLCTTNYDFLLEAAIQTYLGDVYYLSVPPLNILPLLKVHGSPNFIPDPPVQIQGRFRFKGFDQMVECECRVASTAEAVSYLTRDPVFPPAMSLYSGGKQVIAARSFVAEVQAQFSDFAQTANRIFVVGLGPALHDAHIWGPLARAEGTLFYVNPNAAHREIVSDWIKEFRGERPSAILSLGMQEFVDQEIIWSRT